MAKRQIDVKQLALLMYGSAQTKHCKRMRGLLEEQGFIPVKGKSGYLFEEPRQLYAIALRVTDNLIESDEVHRADIVIKILSNSTVEFVKHRFGIDGIYKKVEE